MRYWFQILFLFVAFVGVGQTFPSQQWKYGEAVLVTGDSVKGVMKYNLEAQVIQVRLEEKVATFNASQLKTFSIKQAFGKWRLFYSLPIRNKAGYLQPKLFEMIEEGDVSLLGREFIAIITAFSNDSVIRPRNPFLANLSEPTPGGLKYLAYQLYIADENGKIVSLGDSVNSALNALGGPKKVLKKFIRQNNLTLLNVADYIALVNYYNELNRSKDQNGVE